MNEHLDSTALDTMLRRLKEIGTTKEQVRLLASIFSYDVLRDAALTCSPGKKPEPVPVIHIWVDGGCRGNGTPDACGYYSIKAIQGISTILVYDERVLIESSLPQTNNVAEYYGLLRALIYIERTAREGGHRHYIIHTDSQLVHGQLIAGWKVKSENIKHLNYECAQLLNELRGLHTIELQKDPREQIEAVLGH